MQVIIGSIFCDHVESSWHVVDVFLEQRLTETHTNITTSNFFSTTRCNPTLLQFESNRQATSIQEAMLDMSLAGGFDTSANAESEESGTFGECFQSTETSHQDPTLFQSAFNQPTMEPLLEPQSALEPDSPVEASEDVEASSISDSLDGRVDLPCDDGPSREQPISGQVPSNVVEPRIRSKTAHRKSSTKKPDIR